MKCTACDKHVTRPTLSSGNTFGALQWTDGRLTAPMLPRRYDLMYWSCPECGTFHRTSDLILVDEKHHLPEPDRWQYADEWSSAYEMQEPGWRQYLNGIRQWEKKLARYPDWETELRLLSWHRHNDRFRHMLFRQNKEEHHIDARHYPPEQWAIKKIDVPRVPEMIENCNDAANWLYEGNPDKALDKADLLRWLGRYELALQLLKIVGDRAQFEESVHSGRHELLIGLCEARDSSLGVVLS